MGGRVLFESLPGEGAIATLELPMRSSRENAHAAV
jgi:signal transduction histidine kinase